MCPSLCRFVQWLWANEDAYGCPEPVSPSADGCSILSWSESCVFRRRRCHRRHRRRRRHGPKPLSRNDQVTNADDEIQIQAWHWSFEIANVACPIHVEIGPESRPCGDDVLATFCISTSLSSKLQSDAACAQVGFYTTFLQTQCFMSLLFEDLGTEHEPGFLSALSRGS